MHLQEERQKMMIGGQWVSRDDWIAVRNPQNDRVICHVPKATKDDVLDAIEAAKHGQKEIAAMPIHERKTILFRTADYIEKRHEAYAKTIAQEGSKTIREARSETARCIETLRLSGEEAKRLHGETIRFDQMPAGEQKIGYYDRFPVGIVAAITPFNDPLNLVAHKVGPAVAAGNATIVKPSSETPLSALFLAEAFFESGLPKKALSVITGSGAEIGDVLAQHSAIRMLSFTGGLATGEHLHRESGLKKINMELGSNSPAIVLSDADLLHTVHQITSGAFSAAGQNCLGVQRVYVEEEVYETFCDAFVNKTKTIRFGDKLKETTDMGPLITEKEARRVEEWVTEAVEKGATIAYGGKRDGAYYAPTILENVPRSSTLQKEEVFGPVVLLERVESLEEAIAKANDVPFGLQAGVFTSSLDNGLRAAYELEAGGVMINDSSDFRIDAMPFGGIKGSGLGREGVKDAIEAMTEPKVVAFHVPK